MTKTVYFDVLLFHLSLILSLVPLLLPGTKLLGTLKKSVLLFPFSLPPSSSILFFKFFLDDRHLGFKHQGDELIFSSLFH